MTTMPDVPTTAFSTAGTTATIHAQVAATPIEEFALAICQVYPQAGPVVEHAAVQLDIVTACDHLQGVEL